MAGYEEQWKALTIDFAKEKIAGWQTQRADVNNTEAQKGQLDYNISGMQSLIHRLENMG